MYHIAECQVKTLGAYAEAIINLFDRSPKTISPSNFAYYQDTWMRHSLMQLDVTEHFKIPSTGSYSRGSTELENIGQAISERSEMY